MPPRYAKHPWGGDSFPSPPSSHLKWVCVCADIGTQPGNWLQSPQRGQSLLYIEQIENKRQTHLLLPQLPSVK